MASKHLLRLPLALLSLSRFAGPISGLVVSPSDFGVEASTMREAGREGRGTKKVQGLGLDERTGGGAAISLRGNDPLAREGQRTRLGEKAAKRKGSFFWEGLGHG